MNILITGGTGLVGRALCKKLESCGHEVRVLTRSKNQKENHYHWDVAQKQIDEKAFVNLNCIIHLAGASISKRWTEEYKKELFSSRIDSANFLFDICKEKNIHLKSFISASGINFYGTFTSDKILKESDGVIERDFLAQLSDDWEDAADQFMPIADRVMCLRTAMVLAREDGAFPLLKKTVDFNLGSAVGSGKQWMNWIHLDDLVQMYVDSVENEVINGKINAVAEETVTNKTFMRKLAEASDKLFLPVNVPDFVLKLALGEMSSIILKGTRASNDKIQSLGFKFKYPQLQKAFQDLV